jgi:hypothetical protein
LWWDSQSGILSIYYDVQNTWVAVDNAQQGPIGYSGSAGNASTVPGYTGSIGYTGSRGAGYTGSASNVPGYTGSAGAGYDGSAGATGFTGSIGNIGYTGSQGIQGIIGFTGSMSTVPGYTGSIGIGYTGSIGPIGLTGPRGLQGIQGLKGDTGPAGPIGLTGYTGSAGSGEGTFVNIYNGITPRPPNDKMSEFISVKDYGARGDGIADDTNAINAALAAAYNVLSNTPSNYYGPVNVSGNWGFMQTMAATVYFPAGIYNVSSTITINHHGISILGAGRNATKINTTFASGDLFNIFPLNIALVKEIHNVCISNLGISSIVPRTSGAFIHLTESHNCYFDNLELSGWGGVYDYVKIDGDYSYTNKFTWVQINGGTLQSIPGNSNYKFRDGRAGFVIGESGYPQDTWIDNCEINGTNYGILYFSGGGLQVLRTECLSNNTGMLITPQAGKECVWTWLHMFQVDTGGGRGIVVAPFAAGSVKVVSMTTCWSSSMGDSGIYLDSNGGSISDVTIHQATILTNNKNGIETHGAINSLNISDSSIINNSVSSRGTYHGIYIGPGATRVNIHGNHIGCMNNQQNNQGYGLFIDLGVDKIIVQNNIMDQNVNGGIADAGGTNRIIGNNIT